MLKSGFLFMLEVLAISEFLMAVEITILLIHKHTSLLYHGKNYGWVETNQSNIRKHPY